MASAPPLVTDDGEVGEKSIDGQQPTGGEEYQGAGCQSYAGAGAGAGAGGGAESESEDEHLWYSVETHEERLAREARYGILTDYENFVQIGRGGFGSVFFAIEKRSRRHVAIKCLSKAELHQRDCVHIAMRERRAMVRMNHHFIIRLHKSFQDDRWLYFVLDYLPRSLSYFHNQFTKFRNEVTRFYSAEIIMALEYLRTVNIVHRDLKMDNVLLGYDFHIKLADYGCCVFCGDKEIGSRRHIFRAMKAGENSRSGTRRLFAPEILNKGPITFGTDLWSLGCMLFEMHTGLWPFVVNLNFEHAVNHGLHTGWPPGSDQRLIHLVDNLLIPIPEDRLGIVDLNHVKDHTFYASEDIRDWEHLHELLPPHFDPRHPSARFDPQEQRPFADPNSNPNPNPNVAVPQAYIAAQQDQEQPFLDFRLQMRPG